MKELTITLEEGLYNDVLALAENANTTVEALVRDFLAGLTLNPKSGTGTTLDDTSEVIEVLRDLLESLFREPEPPKAPDPEEEPPQPDAPSSIEPTKGLSEPKSLGKQFLYYWKAHEIAASRDQPDDGIEHVGSNQLERVGAEEGDTIYLLGCEDGTMLLLGKLVIGQITGKEDAEELLGRPVNDKRLHAIACDEELYLPCLIPVDDLLPELEVKTKEGNKKISPDPNPKQFQTMRWLRPTSARQLDEFFEAEFDGPNDWLERPKEDEEE